MQNAIASCFGHRTVFHNVSESLSASIEELITKHNVKTFMTGGMGDFDGQFATAVRGFQRQYKDIKLVLVKPYFSNELNTNKYYYEMVYDDVIIPDVLAGVHPKSAITKRNRWMVENSDFIIAYVHRDHGGAYSAVRYANKIGRPVYNLLDEKI